jgi:phosphopantothenoylcysteine decarboxylase/phosphopantothenate--cysteine ligase
MIENSRKKLESKNLDFIVCNNLKEKGAGFQGDTNKVTIISKEQISELELMSKAEVADEILDRIAEIL